MNKPIEEMAKALGDTLIVDLEGNPHDLSEVLMQCDLETIAEQMYEQNYRKSTDVARDIFADIDNALHAMATEYHQAGHPEYFAVCEVVHHKVMRPIEKKYESEGADDE